MNQKALDQISRSNARRFTAAELEKPIEAAIKEFLEWDGWTVRKMEQNYSERKRKAVGEPGMADMLAIRYGIQAPTNPDSGPGFRWAEVLWIETKRRLPVKRGKAWGRATQASIHQKAWHARERSRGALTIILGEECEASTDDFKRWYFASGLARRIQPSR